MKVTIELDLDDSIVKRYNLNDAGVLQASVLQGLRYILAFEFRRHRKLGGRLTDELHQEYSQEAKSFVARINTTITEEVK